jgi:glycosyltransferase involved in cell wall biosynthesis
MKVIISAGGKFWSFYLAQQLLKRDYLERLVTSMPKFDAVKNGIPPEKIKTVVIKEILERGWRKLPQFVKNIYNPQFFIQEIFDKLACKYIIPSDIFVGWSSFSLCSLSKAKQLGAKTILERGNSHISYQQELLREEYEKFGIKGELAHPKIIEKELREYEETDYIAIPSLFVKRTFLEKNIVENKLIRIPYGVDLSAFKQMSKRDNIFRVIFAGTMCLRKGVHYLLQAFSELKLPNSELLLIGALSNEVKPFFKKYKIIMRSTRTYANMANKKNSKKQNNKSNIIYIGHIPQNELFKYYSQGSVFVMPSIEEGLARVIPQAMSSGLPVICTINTGGEDIVRDNLDGFVIPIRDIEKLKEKLVYLYENPEICKKMGQSAKERVSSGFTWDSYGNKIVEAYKNILAKKL